MAAAQATAAAQGEPVPQSLSSPTISGKPQPGMTLNASPGSWTNSPTRYSYRWEECDAAGAACIFTVSGPGHFISRDEIGHTIRVVVTASNTAGEGAPATSAPTAPVEGPAVRRYLGRSTHRLTIMGSNGYRIKVHSYINHLYHRITLQAEKDGAYARYNVSGYAKNGIIKARYRELGKIAVHFEPRSVTKLPPRPGCQRPREIIEHGVYVGTIRFTGERRFTTIDATRARGSIVKQPAQVCSAAKQMTMSRRGGHFEDIELSASAGAVTFTANHRVGTSVSNFNARAHEANRGMTIDRAIATVISSSGFTYDSELDQATVEPPTPFLGSATYGGAENPEEQFPGFGTHGALSGALQVPLPGLGTVLLSPPDGKAYTSRSVGVYDRASETRHR